MENPPNQLGYSFSKMHSLPGKNKVMSLTNAQRDRSILPHLLPEQFWRTRLELLRIKACQNALHISISDRCKLDHSNRPLRNVHYLAHYDWFLTGRKAFNWIIPHLKQGSVLSWDVH
jgi:hypothetical protein